MEGINIASKYLQSPKQNISTAVDILRSTKQNLEELRTDDRFEEYVQSASVIATTLDIPTNFPAASAIRSRLKKRLHTYECEDETPQDPKTKFKIDFYYKALDQATSSITERFEQLNAHNIIFEFLYNIQAISSYTNEKLINCCNKLREALTDTEGNCDINENDLVCELKVICKIIPSGFSPLDVLQFIYHKSLENAFPETTTSIKILLTLPATVASGERSFSKLKLIKTYLRTSMSQERLVALSTISIEKKIVEELNYDNLIDTFAKLKARRVNFS